MKHHVKKLLLIMAFSFLMVSQSYGAGSIFGQGVTMTPSGTMYNASVTLTVRFRVEGAPVSFYPHELAVRKWAGRNAETLPPPPSVAGATPTTFPVGSHQLDIPWTVPRYEEFTWAGSDKSKRYLKFDIVWGRDRQVLLRDIIIAAPSPLTLRTNGVGMRVYPTPAVAGGTVERTEASLEIVRYQFKDGGKTVEFYAHKPGTGFAANVRWEIEGLIDGRWQHVATGVISRINAGTDARVSKGGFPSTSAEKAKIKIVSPSPEVSVEMPKPPADLNPSNCHVRISDKGGMVDIGLGISNLGQGDSGPFIWEIQKNRNGRWQAFYSERVANVNAGQRFVKGSIFARSGDVQKNEPLQIRVDTESNVRETNEGNNVCELSWGANY